MKCVQGSVFESVLILNSTPLIIVEHIWWYNSLPIFWCMDIPMEEVIIHKCNPCAWYIS
jgi:hypothetical protein